MNTRKLLLIFAFLSSLGLFAGHEKGGLIITYKSLLSGTGDSLKYLLVVHSLYDTQGPTPPLNMSVTLESSCYSSSSFSLPKTTSGTSLLPLLGADYCSTQNTISATTGLAIFMDTVQLPGTCQDFRFSVSNGFSRYSYTSNIASSFNTAYFFATLNNLYGPNSSPTVPVQDLIQAACLNKPLTLYHFTETDGDSTYFSPSTPQFKAGSVIGNFGYNPGYSSSNPVGSTAGYEMDSTTGTVQTELSLVGNFIVTTRFEEYRKDTNNNYVQVGRGRYIMYLSGTSSCDTSAFDVGYVPGPSPDSLGCGRSTLRLATTRKIAPGSVTANGSEFVILSQQYGILPVMSASVVMDSIVEVHSPLVFPPNDLLTLFILQGADSTTIVSRCGQEIEALEDTLVYFTPPSGSISAGFNYSSTFLTVNFSNGLTTPVPDSSFWDFGDGIGTSNVAQPVYSYAQPGTYLVTYIAFNECLESDTISYPVVVCDTILPGFITTSQNTTVNFNASSTQNGSGFIWNFGDGNMGTGTAVQHIYSVAGMYNVTLTVFNPCGDTAQVIQPVEVCDPAVSNWSFTITNSDSSGVQVQFDGSSSQNYTSFMWNFDDGTFDSLNLSPAHLYSDPSQAYNAKLSVWNQCAEETNTAQVISVIGLVEELNSSLLVYPNPTSDRLTLIWPGSGNEDGEYSIYRLNGQLVGKEHFTFLENRFTLNLESVPSGNYVIRVTRGGTTIIKHFVVLKE